jgi:hypothetical protein
VEVVEAAIKELNQFVRWSDQHIKQLDQDIRGHVWLDPSFAVPAVRNLQEHITRATGVLARLEKTKQGFQQLPVESGLDLMAGADAFDEDGYEYKVGDRVTFEDEGTSYSGKIVAIDGDDFTVHSKDGEEWILGIDDLSPTE